MLRTLSTLPALAGLAALGCATVDEPAAWSAFDTLHTSFDPPDTEVAPLDSQTTLETYVALALARNPMLHARGAAWEDALHQIPQARRLPDLQVVWAGFLQPVETRVGPQRHRLGFTQPIPWPGRLAAMADVAWRRAQVAEAEVHDLRAQVAAETVTAYAALFALARDLETTADVLALLRRWEAVAQARLRAGQPHAARDVLRAQVEIGRREEELLSLRDRADPLRDRLRALIDLPAERPIPLPHTLPTRTLAWDEAALRAHAADHAPSLRAQARAVDVQRARLERAHQDLAPDFAVGVDWILTGDARPQGVRSSGRDALALRLGVQIPWDLGARAAAQDAARAGIRAAERSLRAAHLDLQADLTRALTDYRDAARKADLYADALIPKARQSLRVSARAFESGAGDFLDVLDAERTLLDFLLLGEHARANQLTAFAHLERLVGAPLDLPQEAHRD